jgi:2-hydroxycyclohexanecarboxyl-CoA dehydrogenase
VTGAASGLGRAVARQVAGNGSAVAIIDRDERGAAETLRLVRDAGGSGRAYAADIANWDSVTSCVSAIASELGAPRALVNAAAIYRYGHTLEQNLSEWSDVIAINLTGTYHMCRAVLPFLLEQPGASIVNVASTAGAAGYPYVAAYSAAKGGVIQLTRSLAVEFSPARVRINVVVPGGMRTPMLLAEGMPDAAPELVNSTRRARLDIAEPADVANVVSFLLSDRASYMTGSVVVADGGALA